VLVGQRMWVVAALIELSPLLPWRGLWSSCCCWLMQGNAMAVNDVSSLLLAAFSFPAEKRASPLLGENKRQT